MAPLPEALLSLVPRSLFSFTPPTIESDPRSLSPMAVHDAHLEKRASSQFDPSSGVRPATDFNNKGFQALFAIIGTCMVLGSIWFFFWAKNGGFRWQQGDWEDYKSTVLRRKGPDGKTLSNATKSTKLGGGSVVHGGSYGKGDVESSLGYTDETATSADMSEMRDVGVRDFGMRGGEARKHRKESNRNNKHDNELRDYRHERPAKVGGLNRQADGTYADYSNTEPSEVNSNVSQQPLTGPKAKDKKQAEKDKKRRAIERMKEAQRNEKAAKKNAAAEAKAAKEAEKADKAKAKKEDKTKGKKKDKKKAPEPTPSEAPSEPVPAPRQASRRAPPSGAYSFVSGDDTATVYTSPYTATAPSEMNETYYSDYRPRADPAVFAAATRSHNSTPGRRDRDREQRSGSNSRHSSPRKHHRSSRPTTNSDIFSQGSSEETGTKVYPCHIPGLSAGSVGVGESVSQVGGNSGGRRGRDVMDGYRRGGARGRRDSLSDSE